jgi:hypothetical protein
MQTAQATLSHHSNGRPFDPGVIGGILAHWLTRVFGCWHTEMGRPVTHRGETYRACVDCGAHRAFDPQSWEMVGDYYYAKHLSADLYEMEKRAQVKGKRAAHALRLAA